VVGVDSSEAFVAAAKARGLDARVMSAEALTFDNEFDAVFSNAALHWVLRQDEMLAGVWRALKPGGRFVAEMGGAGNVASVQRALIQALRRRGLDGTKLDPWHFPSVEDYRARLQRHGFVIHGAQLFERPTPLPGALADWLGTFAQSFLAPLSAAERTAVVADVEEQLAPKLKGVDGTWTVDYVRLRFHAAKPT